MREAYGAEVLAAMRTPESQITEVGHHRDGVWRERVRQRRTQMRAAALFDPRKHTQPARERTRRPCAACIEPYIFSLLDARLKRSPLIVAKRIRKLNARRISRRADALGIEMSSLERKTPP
jgi:hypothetical protein